jgi:DNA-directed RNA polymerase specialized sigma24 family protein
MYAEAIAYRPKLLMRARQLMGSLADVEAEDLVGDAYLAFVARPPQPRTPSALRNWFRLVIRNHAARYFRELHDTKLESWEAREEAYAAGRVSKRRP